MHNSRQKQTQFSLRHYCDVVGVTLNKIWVKLFNKGYTHYVTVTLRKAWGWNTTVSVCCRASLNSIHIHWWALTSFSYICDTLLRFWVSTPLLLFDQLCVAKLLLFYVQASLHNFCSFFLFQKLCLVQTCCSCLYYIANKML